MKINEYIDSIREAYKNNDYVLVKELEKVHGNKPVTYQELEETYSSQFSLIAGFILALERKEQVHYDLLVDFLTESGIFNEEQLEKIISLEEELNKVLEGE